MSRVQKFKQKDKGTNKGHPIMYGRPKPSKHFKPFKDGGGFPIGFLEWVFEELGVRNATKVLHICSGSVITGVRVDIRRSTRPDVVANALKLPFKNNTFEFVISDPPYSKEYAENLYGTGQFYPSPHLLTDEALRVLRVGGKFGLLHPMIPKFHKPGKLIGTYGITTGIGYNIRAFSVLTKLGSASQLAMAPL